LPDSKLMSNGVVTNEFPFIRRVDRSIGNHTKVSTGVFLRENYMIIPAHIVDRTKTDCGVKIDGISPVICRVHPKYNPRDTSENGAMHDFAVLYFPWNSGPRFPYKPSEIKLAGFIVNEVEAIGLMVGYGSPVVELPGTKPSTTNGDLSGIGGDLSGIGGDLSGIGGDLSGIGGDLSGVGGDLSGIGGEALLTDGQKRKCTINLNRKRLSEEIQHPEWKDGYVGQDIITVTIFPDSDRSCIPAPGDSGSPIFIGNRLIGFASRIGYKKGQVSEFIISSVTGDSFLNFYKQTFQEYIQLKQNGL
jgi:hypothetical protein